MAMNSPFERTIRRHHVKWLTYGLFLPLVIVSGGLLFYTCCGSLKTVLINWPSSIVEQLAWVAGFFFAYVLAIGLHELIHGLTWIALIPSTWKVLRFGFFKNSKTPYCHLKISVNRNVYLSGVVMPGLLLGVVPVLIGLWHGNIFLWLLGLFLTYASLNDAVMAGYLLREKSGSLIKDQPNALGYWVYPSDSSFSNNNERA